MTETTTPTTSPPAPPGAAGGGRGPRRGPPAPPRLVAPPPNALNPAEKAVVLAQLNSERFADQTPYEVYPQLLDEGQYLCSLRGMYRILAEYQAVCDRRNQLRRPARPAPQVITPRP